MAFVVAEETSNGQVDRHLVPGLQVERHDNGGAVLLVLHVLFSGSRHHLAVDHQTGTGSQGVARRTGVAVDGECEAVDAGAGDGEDTGVEIVAVSQVDEDVLVGDELIVAEGAEAVQGVAVGQGDGEGASAGWILKEIDFL